MGYRTTRMALSDSLGVAVSDDVDLDRVVATGERREHDVGGDPALATGVVQPFADGDRQRHGRR